jgi:diaminopimelate decarboxylase
LEAAVKVSCGAVVCESPWELDNLNRIASAARRRMNVLIRINPRRMPRSFSVSMAGKGSQFGIDEENLGAVLNRLSTWPSLDFKGFHIYSGTNSLSEEALEENFAIFIDLFSRFSEAHQLRPEMLIFGAGFGIPYQLEEEPLDVQELARRINPRIDVMRQQPLLEDATCVLETGRFLLGPAGYFLSSVINRKHSRGVEICLCDGGMNAHLAACNMMGSIIRRNWPIAKVNFAGDEPSGEYWLVGPLCTTLDTLAFQIQLPELRRGDLIAVGSSGAYGLTASPTGFISHPEPREYLVVGSNGQTEILDVTEKVRAGLDD